MSQIPPETPDYKDSSVRAYTPSLSKSVERGLPLTKQEELRLKFAQSYLPNFMKKHQVVITRKADEYKVQDAIQHARQRYEQ